jgi:hypothetical protein
VPTRLSFFAFSFHNEPHFIGGYGKAFLSQREGWIFKKAIQELLAHF